MPQIAAAVVVAISYVGSATAAVVAGTATLAQIATVAAVGIGAGVGSMAAAKALTPEIGSQGAAVRWEANPDAPLRFAFGRVGVKGNIVDAAIYGPDRMYVSFACSVSAAGPIKRFVSFRAGDYYMSFDGAGAAINEPYRGEMWLSTRLGAQPDTALSLPSGLKNGASFPGWHSGRKLSGTAAYLVTLGENSKRSAYESKVPTFIATIEGLFCYDPRQDSTYPGGSGSCRLSDPATWVWTQNPILFALKWTLGLWEGPNGKGAPQVDYQVGGIGAKVESIRLTTVVEAANIADANGWTSAAWPSTDDDKAQVLDGFLKAAGARYAEIAGQIAFIHRAAPRAPVFTVRARDTAGPVEIDTASSKLNRFNTVRPRFWSEANEWEMTALPEVTATEWQIEDGQGVAVKRTRGADYTFVVDPKQTRELASLEISNSREGIKGRVPLRPYMDPEPGNTFIFDEPDFALSNLKCFVLDVEDDTENDTVVVTFETETDGKYPYAYGQTGSPPPAQELSPVDPFFVSPPGAGDWTITPRPPAPGGGQLPGFDLTGIVSNQTATAIIVETGPSATGPWTQAYQGPPTVTNIPIDGLQPGATYFIAIQYQRNQNYSAREVFGPFTAPDLVAGDVLPSAPGLSQIRSDIEAAFGDIFDVSDLISQTRIELNAVDAALLGAIEDTNASLGAASASLLEADEALSLAIGAVGDRAQALEETTASLGENKASVSALNAQIARIDDVEAVNATQSSALVDLEAGKVEVNEYNILKAEVAAARDGSPSLLGQIQSLKSVDLDLEANKASVSVVEALSARTDGAEAGLIDLSEALASESLARSESISIQSARVDGVEAVNATQALALVDLENGKVALSEYNTLKGEVLSARDGAPSLLGQIQNLKTVDLDLQNNKASVASVDALTARAATTEADIIDLENALATEAGARAEAISQVAARQAINQNLMPNGSGENGPVGWSGPGLQAVNVPALGGTLIKFALAGSYVENYASSPRAKVSGGQTVTLQWKGVVEGTFSGSLQIYIAFLKADGSYAGEGARKAVTDPNPVLTSTAPGDAAFAILSLFINGNAGAGVNILLSRCKIEAGSVATIYSNDATAAALSASVTEQALALIDLKNNKASVASLNAQVVRIDGVEGVNATQALALIDLENGKVALSEYNTLKGEVTAARDGAPSLRGQIQNLKSVDLDLQNNKASVASVNALTARTSNTEADIIDLENALATETGARAEAIQQVTAKLSTRTNLLYNPTGEKGLDGWAGAPGWTSGDIGYGFGYGFQCSASGSGSYFFNDGDHFAKVAPGGWVSLSYDPKAFGGSLTCWLEFYTEAGVRVPGVFGEVTHSERDFGNPVSREVQAPATGFRARFVALPTLPSSGSAGIRRLKLESGRLPATAYSDDQTTAGISAQVTEQSLAIIDLENQQNIALFRVKAEASGSRPAIIEAYSGLGISAVAFSAEQIYLGDNTVFDDATNTWQTIDGSTVYIRAEGAPFGAFNNLREWWGPTGIALGAMTPDNGYSGRMTTAPYNFTNTLNPKTFSAYASPGSIEAHRDTAGSLTSAVVYIMYQNAKGAVTVTWERLIGGVTGAGTAVIDNPTELGTSFTKTVSAQERTDTVFQATLTDAGSGERRQVIVPVVFTSGPA